MVDRDYCISSYLAFRCIEDDSKEFAEGIYHKGDIDPFPYEDMIPVHTAKDIAEAYKKLFDEKSDTKLGILLSGGMDSACLAAFMKPGTHAYTFRFIGGEFASFEMERAAKYCEKYGLIHHLVDIDWSVVEKNTDLLMEQKGSPIHPIEPQVMEAALQAQKDGVEMMVAADGSDLIFGGMDKMLSRDWLYDEWIDFYTFCDPQKVLKNPVYVNGIFEPYKMADGKMDYLRFMDEVFAHESRAAFCNAFICAGMKYTPFYDPSGMVRMADKLDLERVRNGESKYLIRELYRMCYPEMEIPEKVPMPRPVDIYFKDWKGPTRKEFKENLDMSQFTGNQKWLMWCLERFLNNLDNK